MTTAGHMEHPADIRHRARSIPSDAAIDRDVPAIARTTVTRSDLRWLVEKVIDLAHDVEQLRLTEKAQQAAIEGHVAELAATREQLVEAREAR